ncbi:MAG: hypothetical protein KGJ43_00100 [Acidobacteriota bacterium]|nr:hypothetical protein [Acidobacteriota bacterium]
MRETIRTDVWEARRDRAYAPMARHGRRPPRTQLRRRRALALLAAAVFVAGILVATGGGRSAGEALGIGFARAWARSDYRTMYGDIDAQARNELSLAAFAATLEAAKRTATATAIRVGHQIREVGGGDVAIPVSVSTYLFGTLTSEWRIPTRGEGAGTRVAWNPSLAFPGLMPGERLHRDTTLPARASILADDGSVLAEGSPPPGSTEGERSSALGALATSVVGDVGPIPASERASLEAVGVPPDATVGTSGLERALDARLRGRPGGELLAGSRVLARTAAQAAAAVRTTISPSVQSAAVTALGGQLGGVVALRPGTGEVLAVAGLGIDDLQPPGSTFKMVTVTGVLSAGVAKPSTAFADATSTTVEGVKIDNAGGESCGGTLTEAFAVSCNSVFVPLGIKLGAARLVKTAELFGFNHPTGLPGADESTIPQAAQMRGEVAVGSSAIGQGEVLASALQMAIIAATVADGGRRPAPTFSSGGSRGGSGVQAMSASVARSVTGMMLDVVRYGTGTSAAIPGVEVAGKTGTAELGGNACGGAQESAATAEAGASAAGGESCAAQEHKNTDAWFASFAPARHPRVAVAVLLVRDGYGGETAAPVARQVLEAGLAAHG